MHWKNNKIIFIIVTLAISCFCIVGIHQQSMAAPNRAHVIKVAIPQLEGESVRDENGNLSGYTYEYLEKLGQFNGCYYEYITFDNMDANTSIRKAMEMVENGEADLMGMTLKDSKLEERYEFSKRNYGVVNTMISVLESNTEITEVNFMLRSPLRISVLETAKTRNGELQEYLKSLDITYEMIFCKTMDEQYDSLLEGRSDAMLTVSLSAMPGTKPIVKFAPRPYYFISTKGNSKVIQNVDEAIESLSYAFPYFENQLFHKYFGNQVKEFIITQEEKAFLEKKKELNVLCIADSAPFVFEKPNREMGGIAVSIMNQFGALTGLTIRYQVYDTNMNIDSVLNSRKYDCILGMPVNSSYMSKFGLISTQSYMQVPTVIYTNKKALEKSAEERKVALIKKSDVVNLAEGKEIIYYDSLKDCVEAVVRGEADYGLGNSQLVDYYIEESFADLSVVPLVGKGQNMEFAIPNSTEKHMLSLLNKYIQNMNANDLYTYTIEANSYIQKNEIESYIRTNPIKAALIFATFLFAVFATIVLFFVVQSGKRKNQELKIANAAKTDFFSRVSHDMRTPMNGVVGFSELALEQQQETSVLVDYMKKINESGKYLLRLIDDILDMAQIENKKMILHLELTDIKDFVKSVVSIVQPQMDEKNIQFVTEVEGVKEDERFFIDKIHLQQIVINLLNNAAKFTHENGKITWKIEKKKEENNHSCLKITVYDNGVGMEKELLDRLFIPFEQGSDSYIQKGVGLGLSIVKSLVDLMEGEIKVRSEVGNGTEFVVEIRVMTEKTDDMSRTMVEQKKNDVIETSKLYKKRILLCEDQPINTQLATKILETKGIEVCHAENGKKAVEMFEGAMMNYYHAILMDIRMPILDGLEATRQIRKLEREDAKHIPIIAMTANVFEEDVKKCRAAGMDEHLAKPIDSKRMLQILENYLCK